MIILVAAILLITATFTLFAQIFCSEKTLESNASFAKSCNLDFRRATRPTHGLLTV
jgi:hypothetical protein